MSYFEDEDKSFDVRSLIQLVLSSKNNYYDFLEYSYLLFSSVDNDTVRHRIKDLILDLEMRRRVEVINSLKEDNESKINYYTKDMNDPFDFDEETETTMLEVKLEIFDAIGNLIDGLNETVEVDI